MPKTVSEKMGMMGIKEGTREIFVGVPETALKAIEPAVLPLQPSASTRQ